MAEITPAEIGSCISNEQEIRRQFEMWLPEYWSRETHVVEDGDVLYVEDWVQGAWVMFRSSQAHPPAAENTMADTTNPALQTVKPQAGGSDARELLAYVLQDEQHNRLTPRVIDIAYTAFMIAKRPNAEDGGSSDWFNDARPAVKDAIEKLRNDLAAPAQAAIDAREQGANREVPTAPDACPITGRKFWGNMAHPERGMVALYGGPFDSYSLPELSEDGELRCEHYDQDAGEWEEGGVPAGWFFADQPELASRDAAPAPAAAPKGFPARIMELLRTVANRTPPEGFGLYEDDKGEPMQDDADAAISWITARGAAPAAAGGVVWKPEPEESINACLRNSLARAASLLRSTGHTGDAIDASRLEYARSAIIDSAKVAALAQAAPAQREVAGEPCEVISKEDSLRTLLRWEKEKTHALEREIRELRNKLPQPELLAALTPPAVAAPAVPDGWRLVPVDPTEAMVDAFHCEEGDGAFNKWEAMLAATPSAAPAQAGETGEAS